MKPHLQAFRGIVHVSDSELRRMIVSTPHLLTNPRTLPRLEFWKKFVAGDMKKLFLAATRNKGLVNSDIKSVAPKIALLRDHGLSDETIRQILVIGSRVFALSIPSLELLLKRVQELGFQHGSSMFAYGLSILSNFGVDTFKVKVGVFKSYGWSEREFAVAFNKYPFFLGLSKENIQKKMEFLVGRVGCLQSYIVSHPILLGLSLEKRLMPRYHVISCLKMNKSISREWDLCTIMRHSDNIFLEKFILRYKELEPMLLETYAAACEGRATP